ncbi:MAG: nicotinate mononucleotide-dependent phosphoribosyltransferase CobT [Cyanobacteria bacterium J06598_1]
MIKTYAGETADWINRYRGHQPTFACILSFTETGLIPHLSAAGKTLEDRRCTAALDGNFLLADPLQPARLPPLSAGISPAVITRAVLQSLSIPCHLLSTGLPTPLKAPHIELPNVSAQAVNTGQAMPLAAAAALFEAGQYWGKKLAPAGSYLILGECVVGGTTTAQAVLSALGHTTNGLMSSSHRTSNHAQKQSLVAAGITAWQQRITQNDEPLLKSPLGIAAALGDPMQLVAAGMTLAASQRCGVLLAGGAQMLAVYGLMKAIAQQFACPWIPEQIVVGTTRWVVEDSSADTVAIARHLKTPYLTSQINFGQSPYVQIKAYEQGFVKEGAGAGGCAIASHLIANWNKDQLRHAVEAELRHSF